MRAKAMFVLAAGPTSGPDVKKISDRHRILPGVSGSGAPCIPIVGKEEKSVFFPSPGSTNLARTCSPCFYLHELLNGSFRGKGHSGGIALEAVLRKVEWVRFLSPPFMFWSMI